MALVTDALATMPLPDIIQHSTLLRTETCLATPCLSCDDEMLDLLLETGKPGSHNPSMRLESIARTTHSAHKPMFYLDTAILALILPNMVLQCRIIIIRIA